MNDALRKKLTKQQEQIKTIRDTLIVANAFNATANGGGDWYDGRRDGIITVINVMIDKIEAEKQKKGRTE